jgi:hypothetical protein
MWRKSNSRDARSMARVCSLSEQSVDPRQQLRTEFRFADKAIRTCGLGQSTIFWMIMQGQNDDVWRALSCLNVARRFQAVHLGHSQIHQHQIRLQSGYLFQGVATRIRTSNNLDLWICG